MQVWVDTRFGNAQVSGLFQMRSTRSTTLAARTVSPWLIATSTEPTTTGTLRLRMITSLRQAMDNVL